MRTRCKLPRTLLLECYFKISVAFEVLLESPNRLVMSENAFVLSVYLDQRPDKLPDDYVTRGVTLGGNSSAIATAVLLVTDPRAAALSSLSMSLFGIITLALTSVPVVVKAINSLVEL